MNVLVTGGAGFISAKFLHDWLATSREPIIYLDKFTYAGNPETLVSLEGDARHQLEQSDISYPAWSAALGPTTGGVLLSPPICWLSTTRQ